ncbi:MAG: HlyC/CorC family transporter [Chloroflexi bacterium]|nr:HlyC/CorC family transporter [Chloroflexota bacterium]
MTTVLTEVIFLFVLILINGLFSMSEMAVVSARKARLQEQANKGSAGARFALQLSEEPNQFLSTVQVGITLVGVLAGAFGGARLAELLGEQFNHIGWIAPHGESVGLGLVVLMITYFSLVIGELVPKRLALQNPERIAALVARPMWRLSLVAYPVVRLLSFSTNGLLRLFGTRPDDSPPITVEEIRLLIHEGTAAGVFEATEQAMVDRVFRLDDRRVSALMTPHTEIIWLDQQDTHEETLNKVAAATHPALLLCAGGLDHVLGVVNTHDVLLSFATEKPYDHAKRRPFFIPESASVVDALDMFKRHHENLIVVIDEHGGVQGVITKHDILEALVGNIPQRGGQNQPNAVQREDQAWVISGLMPVEDFRALLHLDQLPGENRSTYQTVGGFVMHQIGKIPAPGETFEWNGCRFEVTAMDGRRVDQVVVQPIRAAPPQS